MEFLCYGPLIFVVREPLLPLLLQNPSEMIVDNVGLKLNFIGTSSSMATIPFIFLISTKWFLDKFNDQSHILEEQGTTSWSMM